MTAAAPTPAPALSPSRDALRPRSADSPLAGAMLSVLAHVGLVAALTLGVQWRTEGDTPAIEAELWAAVPQMAAPPAPSAEPAPAPTPESTPPAPEPQAVPAPPPVPAPRVADSDTQDATIATERARKAREAQKKEDERLARIEKAKADKAEKREKERQEKLAKEQRDKAQQAEKERLAKAEKARQDALRKLQERDNKEAERQEKAEAVAREKLRRDQMERLAAQLGGTGQGSASHATVSGNGPVGSTGTARRSAGPTGDEGYAGRIKARIKPNIFLTDPVPGNPVTEVEVRVGTDGSIIGRRITKPSEDKDWDEAVLRAIDRTGMLPRKTDGRVEPVMLITFTPYE